MIARRHVSIVMITSALALALSQFQNCAPTNLQAQPNVDSNVKIVDEYSKADISFISEDTQIHDEAVSATVDGLCSRTHNGSSLSWAVYASTLGGRPLATGESVCKMGGFNVQLSALENLDCGEQHLLVVEGSWGGSAVSRLSKRCQPLASEPLVAPDSSPMGTQCSLEYRAAAGSSDACMEVCYRDSKVVLAKSVSALQCQPIVDKLVAGH